ncbi:Methyltransferase domain-containing protein [Lentzea albidocapillata subsp. violacea]|uniref:Methyltransferase domain-containing protein n=1 Tax=Lentzea albidocapillata subsp. violacea TaxID=128104 RepID=A0A1H0AKE7_9PSEU|nr:class I SAM-dependent methyltransferase [Lentzea albidocapillata]SDN34030.1 Methyltransferase domain-containing protein [Lentzea albidocapillata subsp. violacea]
MGTVLSLVNQGTILSVTAYTSTWVRVAVNYVVPFIVAGMGYLSVRRTQANTTPWSRYLAGFHEDRAGITERLLGPATDRRGKRPYPWLVEPLRGRTDVILDLACGSAPTRDLLREEPWLGVDLSAGELALARQEGRGPVLRARGDQLPIGDGTVGAVCAAMCLPVVTPLDAVLAELKRVLRPGGMLVALVPSRMGLVPGLAGWLRVMRALGIRSQPWPNPDARDRLPKILRAHGFVVDDSRRLVFRRDISDPGEAALLVEGLYLPGVEPDRIDAARTALVSWAKPGRRLPFPLRRVIAHLPGMEN